MQYFRTLFCFLLLITALLVNATAQNNDSFVWAPVGATWHYSGPNCNNPSLGDDCDYYTINSVKDSLFRGKHSKILEWRDENNLLMHRAIMYNKGDSVFYFDTLKQDFQLLYNFGANEGDTIILSKDSFGITNTFVYDEAPFFSDLRVVIDSVSTIKVQNKSLKKFYTSKLIDTSTTSIEDWGYHSPVIEGIGCIYWMFGVPAIRPTSNSLGGLRCYKDSSIFYKPYKDSCDHIAESSGIDNKFLNKNNINIIPQPFHKKFELIIPQNLSPAFHLKIWNMHGKIVKKLTIYKNNHYLQFSNLDQGMYFLQIKNKQTVLKRKFLKR